ncbi:MAG: A/G-specific adenine glycosylase [Bacteroidales bacterium]|nr:A/G-specific adenine glycosylase [Bacteroidales bacterium]
MFAQALLTWYDYHQRDLPWRGEKDPYKVWVSEIILQQTRVQQGWDYYHRFIETFPDVRSLAEADEQEVLRVWQGLGYYSRARHIHHAAKQIMSDFGGIFPARYEDIRTLKGVGDYTAAAIAAFAFGLPHPAVDGNMLRVFSRYFGIREDIALPKTRREITARATREMKGTDPAKFNQAMMDFGATQCTPANPDCSVCPLQKSCYAHQHDLTDMLPVKIQKIKKRQRYFRLTMYLAHNKTILEKRVGNDIWRNMYQFPLQEFPTPPEQGEHYVATIHETLTHQQLQADLYVVPCRRLPKLQEHQIFVSLDQLSQYPMPKIMTIFLKEHLQITLT